MHHALEVPEILAVIASDLLRELLKSSYFYKESSRLPTDTRLGLLKCALTCRAFSTAILPLIWNRMQYNDIPYLAKTMRAGTWSIFTHGYHNDNNRIRVVELLSADYELGVQWFSPRFEFYASCIKFIDFNPEDSYSYDSAPSRTFSIGASVLQAWTRFTKHRRLFPALTSLSHMTTCVGHQQPFVDFFDTLRATHDIRSLLVDVNDSWSQEGTSVRSTFLTDLATGRCGKFESLEIGPSLNPSSKSSFDCMSINANMRRLVIKTETSITLLWAILSALPELRYCLISYLPTQEDVPIAFRFSSLTHLTHLAHRTPTIRSLKDALSNLPAPQLEELVCELTQDSEVAMKDVLSVHSVLSRWQSSLAKFKLSNCAIYGEDKHPRFKSINGSELIQLITSFGYLKSLRSLSLEVARYTRAANLKLDEEDGKTIASAYGDAVKEMGLGLKCLLPPPVFVPIITSGRFSRCFFATDVGTERDFYYLLDAAESAPSEVARPHLNETPIHAVPRISGYPSWTVHNRIADALSALVAHST